ncbi:hypothetical protein F5Y17DRAFT_218721 [Xylariaceae sp. FL0594]|nr:hypothetical protein F5Y17DRAFT_218721 [Xylariaceae sp. FL0594]
MSSPPPNEQPPTRPARPIHHRGAGASPNSTTAAAARGAWTKPKVVIYTAAFAAVTIVGAIYGAGLKTQQEYKAEKRQIIQATPEERVRVLESRRAALVAERLPLERKLEELRRRVRRDEEAAAAAAGRANSDGR